MRNYLDSCLDLDAWHTPATDYPREQVGNYRLKTHYYEKGHYHMYGIDGHIFFQANKRLPITNLQEKVNGKWQQWMVDDPPHWRAMEIYGEKSEGKVLVAGLGLALVLHALAENPKITAITCVEISQNVIALISPNILNLPKLEIVQADFYDYYLNERKEWDGMIVDLWVANKDTKMPIFYREVLPTGLELSRLYPNTALTFHGFPTISHIKTTTPEMTELIGKMYEELGDKLYE